MALCTGCKKVMTHVEFDQHNCPANPGSPLDGESWDDYSARCDKFKKEWEEDQTGAHALARGGTSGSAGERAHPFSRMSTKCQKIQRGGFRCCQAALHGGINRVLGRGAASANTNTRTP